MWLLNEQGCLASLSAHAVQVKLMPQIAAHLNHDRLQSAHNVLEGALATALLLAHGVRIHNDHRAPQAVQAIKEQQTPVLWRLNILLHGDEGMVMSSVACCRHRCHSVVQMGQTTWCSGHVSGGQHVQGGSQGLTAVGEKR